MDRVTLLPGGCLRGRIQAAPDKSISHRVAIAAALAEGQSEIQRYLKAEDTLCTLHCLAALGVPWRWMDDEVLQIDGVGLTGLREPADVLNAGNSGTTARILSGVLAAQPFVSILTGDASLRQRPMQRVVEPLGMMGARFIGRSSASRLPLAISGAAPTALTYRSPRASAQVKSALLFAGLFADGETRFEEPLRSRDHTERLFAMMGVPIVREANAVMVRGLRPLTPIRMTVPGDWSSAAFWLVAASVAPDSDVLIEGVGINPTRTGLLDVLDAMGAKIDRLNTRVEGAEPVCDLRVRSARLSSVEVSGDLIPRLIDEIPVLALACVLAQGRSIIRDASELRVKESDRLQMTASQLSRLGAKIIECQDGLIIDGVPNLGGGCVSSAGDHRIAMTLAIAALRATDAVDLNGIDCIRTSYPNFWEDFASLKHINQPTP